MFKGHVDRILPVLAQGQLQSACFSGNSKRPALEPARSAADIRATEQDLIAANAQIGVARSLYFPTISLTGLVGTASASLSSLFTGPASVWALSAAAAAPVFTFGNIEGQVQATEAVQRQALERYWQTILIAQNELFSAELAHAQNQADSLTQLVNVYKAMGGGWVIEAERIAPKPTSDRRLSVSEAD